MLSLIKAALKTGLGSMGSILFGVIAMKIFAIFLGPNGVGLFSILRQTTQTGLVAATIGGQTAFVQGIASRQPEQQHHYIRCVCVIFIISSLCVSIGIAVFSQELALLLLGHADSIHSNILRLLAFAIFTQSWTVYTASILNGFGAIGKLAFQQVVATFTVAIFAYPASVISSIDYGLLLATLLVLSSLASLLYGLIMIRRLPIKVSLWQPRWHKPSATHFFSISGTTLFTTVLNLGSILLVRMMIVQRYDLPAAGYFDVAWTVSMTYVMLILGSLSTYYMPKLSQIHEPLQQQQFMQQVFRFVLFAMLPIVSMVIVVKPLIIHLLYTSEFHVAQPIIRWMLIGDFFKALTWVLTMPMLSYVQMRLFFWFQFGWNFGFIGLSYLSLYYFNSLEAIGFSFFLLYILQLIPAFIYSKKVMNFLPSFVLWLQLIISCLFIGLISVWVWDENQLNYLKILSTFVASLMLMLCFISKAEQHSILKLLANKFSRTQHN